MSFVHPLKDPQKVVMTLDFMVPYFSTDPREIALFKRTGLWGKRHQGIDLAPLPQYRNDYLDLVAPVDGLVQRSGYAPDYGFHVRIIHASGKMFLLAHLASPPKPQQGTNIVMGTPLGYMGSSGNSTARHLHYEVRTTAELPPPKGCRINPHQFLTFNPT